MSCPCCSPMLMWLIVMLLVVQYFAVPALLAGFLSAAASFSAGVLFTPLVLLFQSSQFTVYELLFFICCAHWLVSCVKLIRGKKFVDITANFWVWITIAPLGALCLFMVDLFMWYQLFGLFLILYAVFVFFNGQSRVPHNDFFGSIEAFLAGFFGLSGPFLTTPKTPVLDYFINDTTRLFTYLYALNGLERLRESSSYGHTGIFIIVVGTALVIAFLMVVGERMGGELGDIVRKKISARACKVVATLAVLLIGIMLLRHGFLIKPKAQADLFFQQTQSLMSNVLRN